MKKSLCFLGIGAAALLAGTLWFAGNFTIVNGSVYPQDATVLDLSGGELKRPEAIAKLTHLEAADLRNTGLTPEDYEYLREEMPWCEILWLVPFQGKYLDPGTTSLTLSSITDDEIPLLDYFPGLNRLDMRDCSDVEAILKVKERYPHCDIQWMVPFQGSRLDCATEVLTISTLTEEDLTAIGYFSNLKAVNATDCSDLGLVQQLAELYPDCRIHWQVPLGSQKYPGDTAALTIADADTQELMTKLQYLPQLKSLTFEGEIPDNDAIYQLKQAYPQVEFIWDFTLCGVTVNSNAAEIDLSNIEMESVEEVENSLKYFNRLEKVIMCKCGISNEDMDALWKRNPEVRFVWSVVVGQSRVRTDTTDFMPWKLGYTRNGKGPMGDGDAKNLKYLVDVVVMDLGHNSIHDLSFLYYMPNMEYFMMCECYATDITPIGSLKKLKYLEIFENRVMDLSPLAECTALEDVNLCYNPFQDITPLLGLNLKNIWISGWMLPKDQLELLHEAFPNATIVDDSPRSTAAGWRDLPNYFAQRDLLGLWYMTTP